MSDLPKDAQEIADALGLDEDSAAQLWGLNFSAEARAEMEAAGVDVAEFWADLKEITPEGIRRLIAMAIEERALQAKADEERAKADSGGQHER